MQWSWDPLGFYDPSLAIAFDEDIGRPDGMTFWSEVPGESVSTHSRQALAGIPGHAQRFQRLAPLLHGSWVGPCWRS